MATDRIIAKSCSVGRGSNVIHFQGRFRVFSRVLQTGKNKGGVAIDAMLIDTIEVLPEFIGLAKTQNISSEIKNEATLRLRDACVSEFVEHERNLPDDRKYSWTKNCPDGRGFEFEVSDTKPNRLPELKAEWQGRKLNGAEIKSISFPAKLYAGEHKGRFVV